MISVVIPLYNKEQSISSTVACVLGQSYADLELIIVDDGSKDCSADIVRELLPSDSRIRLVCKPNGGVSSARNEGIRQAQGEYLAFLDADDYWEPDYLQTQADLIRDFPEASIWCTGYGHMIDEQKASFIARGVTPDFRGLVDSYFARFMYLICTDTVITRRSMFELVGYFDERISIGEDIDMWWRILLHGQLAYTAACKAYYRQDAENRLSNSLSPFHKHFAYYIEKYEPLYLLDPAFKRYAQRELLMHMYPFFLANPKDPDILRVLSHIDFSLQTRSYKLRYHHPVLYKIILALGLKK